MMILKRYAILLGKIGFLSNNVHVKAVKSRYKNAAENEFQQNLSNLKE